MPQFLGIDVGTSFVKAAVIDLETLQLSRTAHAPFPQFVAGLSPSVREVEPGAVTAAVDELLERLMPHTTGLAGVAFCGQMHGFVLVNSHGEAISNYISWMDQRVAPEEFAAITAQVTESARAELGNE